MGTDVVVGSGVNVSANVAVGSGVSVGADVAVGSEAEVGASVGAGVDVGTVAAAGASVSTVAEVTFSVGTGVPAESSGDLAAPQAPIDAIVSENISTRITIRFLFIFAYHLITVSFFQ